MTDTKRRARPDLVWYAGYGSNLCAERFACYIAGGIPPGRTDPCRGARDRTLPRRDRPLDIPHRLYFADRAESWGGAPCFVDATSSPHSPTHARAYLITWGQFEDVVAQENGRAYTPEIELDPAELPPGASRSLGPRRYETLLCLGRLEGIPVLTITSPWAIADVESGAPSLAYLKVMITGLRQAHAAMSDDAIVAYLGSAPGCSEELVVSALAPRPGTTTG